MWSWENTGRMLAASDIPAAPVLAVMGLGVLIAIGGHATKIKGAGGLGIALIFLATAGMVVGGVAPVPPGSPHPPPKRPDEGTPRPWGGAEAPPPRRGAPPR